MAEGRVGTGGSRPETDTSWRKSSASGSGNCVEVGISGEAVLVRNSRNRTGSVVSFTKPEWDAFLRGARQGEFDLDSLG
nr:DUF397 domain-containing protein [Micromonospora sp. DSM 115978]